MAVKSELLCHHVQFDQEGPSLLGAGLPVLLQLVAEPKEAAADAACEQIRSAAPLAGERLARQLDHFLREDLILVLNDGTVRYLWAFLRLTSSSSPR